MPKKPVMEVVESISFTDIKLGQFIQLENDDKTYVVVQHGQMYHLMPVALDKQLVVCFYDVKKAQAALYPTITISGTGTYTNSLGAAISNPGSFLVNFVAGLTQPIFMNGRLTAQLKVAKIDYEVAEKEWRQSILEAGAEVSNCLVEYNCSKEKSDLEKQQVEALARSVDYTMMLYKMGSSTYLEVIAAQRALLNAEISQVTDDFNKMQAVVNLYSALGGGKE